MYKTDLIAAVTTRTGMPKADAENAVNAVLDTVTEVLSRGDSLIISGFGTFSVKERAARKGVNPHTKEENVIPAGRVPSFKASKSLKDAVKDTTLSQ